MLSFAESLAETMFRFTRIVMLFAPIGVGAAIAYTVGSLGVGMLVNLAKLLATFYVAVAVFVVGVLLPVALLAQGAAAALHARRWPSRCRLRLRPPAPRPRCRARCRRWSASACRVRSSRSSCRPATRFNLDGSTLYLSLTSIFVAQAAGIDLTIGQQLVMLLTLMLSSKGVAGVPRGAVVVLLGTVATFKLPVEPVLVILGIDAVLDMLRTSVNVLGNCLATVVIARWEGEYREPPALEPLAIE